MVIVAGTIDVAPGERDRYLDSRMASMFSARAEPGCLEFVRSPDPVEPDRIRLFELWESEEALDAHLARPRPPESPDLPVAVARHIMRYLVSSARPNTH